jgi:hypothetical protein
VVQYGFLLHFDTDNCLLKKFHYIQIDFCKVSLTDVLPQNVLNEAEQVLNSLIMEKQKAGFWNHKRHSNNSRI